MSKEIWNDSSIQFPRLIAEINAVGLTSEQIKDLCASMNLHPDELSAIFERANTLWEVNKSRTLKDSVVHVNCPSCDGGVLQIEEVNEDNVMDLTCLNCETQVLIDEDGFVS